MKNQKIVNIYLPGKEVIKDSYINEVNDKEVACD